MWNWLMNKFRPTRETRIVSGSLKYSKIQRRFVIYIHVRDGAGRFISTTLISDRYRRHRLGLKIDATDEIRRLIHEFHEAGYIVHGVVNW